ncbi:MAG: secretin N-terminal domain-containing protein [Acidobacteriota bacterium]
MKRAALALTMVFLVLPLWFGAQGPASFEYVLRYRDVRSVVGRLGEELGPRGRISVDGLRNAVTVSDDAERLPALRRLLRDLDVPARRFALEAVLDLLSPRGVQALFKSPANFVDASEWAQDAAPRASFRAVTDLTEGGRGTLSLGKDYRLEAEAQGYDPVQRRLGLKSVALYWTAAPSPEGRERLRGAAVLPEGRPTLFLLPEKAEAPPLRLRITPTLLPRAEREEVP